MELNQTLKKKNREGGGGREGGKRKEGSLAQHSFAENPAHLEIVFHLLVRFSCKVHIENEHVTYFDISTALGNVSFL